MAEIILGGPLKSRRPSFSYNRTFFASLCITLLYGYTVPYICETVTRQPLKSSPWPVDELVPVPRCPLCGSDQRILLHDRLQDHLFDHTPGLWTLHRCKTCRAGFLDPRPNPASMGRAYDGYYTHDQTPTEMAPLRGWKLAFQNGFLNADYGYSQRPAISVPAPLLPARLRHKAVRSIRHLHRSGSAVPRLLDLGCGNGSFLSHMQSFGWKGVGLEPDPRAVQTARRAGLDVEHGTLTESRFAPGSFDAVTMNHVIEHLHDPVRVLAFCHRVLRPHGILWIATPNLDSLGHTRFGPSWRGLEPPRHTVLFTVDALRGALQRAGFEPDAAPRPGMGAGWMFRASARIRLGNQKISTLAKMRLKWHAIQANHRSRQRPHLAEEIVLLSRKR